MLQKHEVPVFLAQRRAAMSTASTIETDEEFAELWETHGNAYGIRFSLAENPNAPQWLYRRLLTGGWGDHMLLTSPKAHPEIEILRQLLALSPSQVENRTGYRTAPDLKYAIATVRDRARLALSRFGVHIPAPEEEVREDYK